MNVLSEWLNLTFFDNSLGAYARALINFVAIYLVLLLTKKLVVSRLGKLAAQTANDLDDFAVGLIGGIGQPALLVLSLYLSTLPLQFDESFRRPFRYALVVALTVQIALMLQKAVRYGVVKMYRVRSKPGDPGAEVVTRNLSLILGWIIWALGAVFILDNLGVNIGALVAGLGIGGVAVAMASQAVLGDLFSAFSIFIDKPFEVGDFIVVDNVMGTVEYVGLKTTRLRSLSGEQIVISNSDLTKSRVQNFKRMETRRIEFKISIVYETPLDKMRRVPELVRGIIERIEGLRLDRVHLAAFGQLALEYAVVYFVQSADYSLYMDKQQAINFALKEAFDREGSEVAHTTKTVLVGEKRPSP